MNIEQKQTMRERLKNTPYWLLGLLILFLSFFCGVKLRYTVVFSAGTPVWAYLVLVILCAFPVILVVVQFLKTKRFHEKLDGMDAAERVRFILAHRENAAQTAAEKYRLLKRLHRGSQSVAYLLLLTGAALPLFNALCFRNETVFTPLLLYALALAFAALPRMATVVSTASAVPPEALDPEDYPALYGSLRAAAEKMGYEGDIRVCVTPDCNAGIVKTKNGCIAELGVLLWYVVTPEELTAIFLHEFAHLQSPYVRDGKADAHMAQLGRIEQRPFFLFLQRLFYSYFDNVSVFERELFEYSVSLLSEEAADDLMLREGDTKTAASGLLKTGYYPYYEWMNGTVNTENLYQTEETLRFFVERNAECFVKAAEANCEKWNRLIETELPSRSATHPLLRDRLKKLGAEKLFRPDFSHGDGAFAAECEKAASLCAKLICDGLPQPFDAMRREMYEKPKETVDVWEAEGCPLEAETYADIDAALRSLGRTDEANALCRKAIETLPPPAAMYAHYTLGLYLLHDFDAAGLPFVYKAAEGNSNFTADGFEAIGSFCCMMGLADELEEFRVRSVAASQKEIDFYSKMGGLHKRDDLSAEHLPPELRDDLTAFFARIDGGNLQSVSVIRKTISPEYFVSPVIVRFVPGVPDETKDELMHKVFMHLDTCSDWQFFLYDYGDVVHVGKTLIDGATIYGEALPESPEHRELTKKYRRNLAVVISSFVLLVTDIFVTVYLTGQREISDFSRNDWRVFTVSAIIAALLCLFMFLFAARTGRLLKERQRKEG